MNQLLLIYKLFPLPCVERDHSEAHIPKTTYQPLPGDGQVPSGAHRACSHRL